MWRIDDPDAHRAVIAELADSELLIADGHHRYETARTYADEIGGDGPHRYTLMALVSLADPGLTVFGYHRLLTDLGDPAAQAALRDALLEHFEVEEVAARATSIPPARRGSASSATSTPTTARAFACGSRTRLAARAAIPGASAAFRELDAAILETLILRGALGMSAEDIEAKRGIAYDGVGRARARLARPGHRRRLPDAPDPGRAGARGRRGRRDDAAEVDLLLPQAAHRPGLQPAELSPALGSRHVTRIYTKKGDDGTTSLWYGGRVAKSDPRTEAYGALDEAASALGVARSLCGADEAELAADILRLQDDLFIAGAELATAPEAAERLVDGVSRVTPEMAAELERLIDRYMDRVDLPPKFVIPGGTPLSAQLDLAPRDPAPRRAPRGRARRRRGELVADELLRFLNRASDAAYAMARFADVDDPELFAGREREHPKT